ncbi:beta strand repeat-containing protein, partial [Cellulophaga baltica]
MNKLYKYTSGFLALLALIIACTKEVGLYTEVEFEITEEHEADGFISTPLATFLTITPEELLEDLSYSFSYKINSGAGYFEAVDGTTIEEGVKVSFNPLSSSLDYIPTAIGDHSVTFTASDTFGFTEEITLTYTITNIPVTWTAEGPTDPVLLGSSQSITVTLGNEAAVTGATYQRNYSFSEGSGNLYTAAPESNTIAVNDFVSIAPGTYQLEYISNELGVTTIEFLLRDSNEQELITTVTFEVVDELSSEKEITSFIVNGVAGTITGTTIDVVLPEGTDLTALAPVIIHTGESISPESEINQDFSNSVIYTVTAQDETIQAYTVTSTIEGDDSKDITTFTIDGVNGTITGTDITITLPSTTNVTALEPTVTHTGASVNPASGVAQDFTNPLAYTVTAEDASTQDYTVTVTVAQSESKDITSLTIDGINGTITGTDITVILPSTTDVTALEPTITHTGASINPASGVVQDFTSPVEYTVTAADGNTKVYTVTVSLAPALSSDKDITSFTIDGETVNDPATAFTITLPAGTDVTALSPTITHTGATINPASGVVQDFTSPVEYTVTAADGTTKVYTVTVSLAPALSSDKDITSLTIDGETVNDPATAFTITLPAGTDVTALSPTITHTGASINPASGVVQDFTNPVEYTVTAADGTTQVYTVTVSLAPALSSDKDITSFTIGTVNGIITGTNISLTLPAGTDVTALSPSITHTGVSINPAIGVAQDFTSPVEYTVTAADGSTQVYSVTVTAPALSSTKAITAFTIGTVNGTITGTNISLALPAGTDVTALSPSITHTGASINPASGVAQNFTSPVEYTVTAADGTTQVYTVTVSLAPALSSDKDITSFTIGGVSGTISGTNISLTLPAGTDVTALSPSITHTGVSINPASGVAQNFTSPVEYMVTAADGSTQVYSVTVTSPALSSTKAITAFTIGTVNGTITGTNISLALPAGTDVTALSPSITHTGTSINPASGVAQNFTSPVEYTVTAADGSTQVYSVTVTAPALSSTKAITEFVIGGVNGTITGTNISLTLPAGTDVTALSPSITHSGVSINPATGAVQDFS